MRLSKKPYASHPRGAALLAVIWLIGILGIAAMATLRVISFDIELATAKVHGSRARQIAEMGIAVGSNPAVKRTDPLLRQLNEETGEGFQVKLISEGNRFNINAILLTGDKPLMREILVHWGSDIDTAGEIVDALIDWVDENDEVGLNGAEVEWYEANGRFNQPFNRPFYNLEEMRLVRGMDQIEAMYPGWREWFTVWSAGQLDLNEAPKELISVAAEVTPEQASAVSNTVVGPDGIRDTDDDVPFRNVVEALSLLGIDPQARPDLARRFTVNDSTTRIESTGYAEGAKKRISVILRNRTGRPALLDRTEETLP